MKQLCALCCLLLFSLIPSVAQAQQTAPYEVSAGYSLRVFTQPGYARVGLNGVYGSFDYNIINRVSASAEVSSGLRNQGVNGDLVISSIMVGPQIFPFGHRHKITPFAHVMFGEGFYRNSYPAYGGFPAQVTTDSKFSWEAGGGVDWIHNSHWAIRVIQLDFAQTKFFANQSQTNYRASIGVVYRFGQK
jgi:hypothetical protein